MARPRSIAEIVEDAGRQPSFEHKVHALRVNDGPILRNLLRMAVDPNIKWLVPEGPVPYKPTEFQDQENMLYKEARTLYLYIDGPNTNRNLSPKKREQLFIQLLECLDPRDAKFLVDVRNHRLPPGIDINVIRAAWPGII